MVKKEWVKTDKEDKDNLNNSNKDSVYFYILCY